MHVVEPKIFVIAETATSPQGLTDMLHAIGAHNWSHNAVSQGELLVEVAGRLCYKSFEVGLNANVTKVREGNHQYIGNILKQQHGSVLEHANTTVAFIGASRILTHELVRHRAGAAYSQESMRYVRLEDIPMYIPDLTDAFTELAQITLTDEGKMASSPAHAGRAMQKSFEGYVQEVSAKAENAISQFTGMLNHPKVPFHVKKVITSALRRLAPGGHSTNIIVTANHRAWRHMISTRTAEGAEEEIRKVFKMIALDFVGRYPAIYQDMDVKNGHYFFANDKV